MEVHRRVLSSNLRALLQDIPTQWEHWIHLAQIFGIDDSEIEIMKTSFLHTFDLSGLLDSVLIVWISRTSEKATLRALISAMKLTGLKNAAEKLETIFSQETLDMFISQEIFEPTILQNNVYRNPVQVNPNGPIFYFEDRRIGHGATANVYEGFFEVPHQPAAVKIMDEEFTEIHLNEIEVLRQARHQYIVRYFMTETRKLNQQMTHYIAMELAYATLEDVIEKDFKDCSSDNRSTALSTLQIICRHASEGLQCLHFKRILHRDIKPSNVLLFHADMTGYAVAKLGDFGISRKAISIVEGTDSMGKGTLDWMAPEAMENINKNDGSKFKTTYGVDIFSLGVTMFWSITFGEHPFRGRVFRYGNIINNPLIGTYLTILAI